MECAERSAPGLVSCFWSPSVAAAATRSITLAWLKVGQWGIIAGEYADRRSLAAGEPDRGLGANLRRLGLRAGVRCQDYSALARRVLVAARNTAPSLGFFAGLMDHRPE
jgi:hypothetical protein